MSVDADRVWRLRSRGNRWIVPARDDYITLNPAYSARTFVVLYDVGLSDSVIAEGEINGSLLGEASYSFELRGALSATYATITLAATGTVT